MKATKEDYIFRLKQVMDQKGLRAVDVLERCKPYSDKYGIAISKGQLSGYLNGRSLPKQDKIFLLAKALGVSEAYLMGFKDSPEDLRHEGRRVDDYVRIPVLGKVSAGIPIEAITDYTDWEEIPKSMASKGTHIALTIHGTSMLPRMQEGDVVIVRQQNDVESGEIAVVFINGDDATCKKVVKTENGVWLKGLNDTFEPMYFTNEQVENLPIRILGKVVELRAKF